MGGKKSPTYLIFPSKAIKRFLADPTERNLELIQYNCSLLSSPCRDCPFNTIHPCPPPSGMWEVGEPMEKGDLSWYNNDAPEDLRAQYTLSSLVLKFSEALAIYESKRRKK